MPRPRTATRICSLMIAERVLPVWRASSGVEDEMARIEIMTSMSTIIQMILSPWMPSIVLCMNPFLAMVAYRLRTASLNLSPRSS